MTIYHITSPFVLFKGSKEDLAHSKDINKENFDDTLPIVYGTTGVWKCLAPIKRLDVFKNIKLDNKNLFSMLKEKPLLNTKRFREYQYYNFYT